MCTHPHWNDSYKKHSGLLILSTALCTNGASTPNPLGQPISTYHRRLCWCCYLYFLLCYDKKEKRQVMHWKTQNTACSYAHGDTFLFSFGDIPPFKHEKYLPVYNFISLSLLSHHHHHRKEKKKCWSRFSKISVLLISFLKKTLARYKYLSLCT